MNAIRNEISIKDGLKTILEYIQLLIKDLKNPDRIAELWHLGKLLSFNDISFLEDEETQCDLIESLLKITEALVAEHFCGDKTYQFYKKIEMLYVNIKDIEKQKYFTANSHLLQYSLRVGSSSKFLVLVSCVLYILQASDLAFKFVVNYFTTLWMTNCRRTHRIRL
jgi:hypothetical protein